MTDYRTMARDTALRYGIPANLFDSLIEGESSFDPWAVGAAGEIGLGQLMPSTAAGLGVDPWDPESNLSGAARYLKQHYETFGNWRDALSAYKSGPGNYTSTAARAAADKVLSAAGLDVAGQASAAADKSAAWSWSNPWPWLKARGLDLGAGALGVLLIVAGVLMLTNTGGAFVQGVREGAAGALGGGA